MSFLRHFNETRNTEVNPEAKQKARDFIISFFKESGLNTWTEEFPSNNAKVSPTFRFLDGDFLQVVCIKFSSFHYKTRYANKARQLSMKMMIMMILMTMIMMMMIIIMMMDYNNNNDYDDDDDDRNDDNDKENIDDDDDP